MGSMLPYIAYMDPMGMDPDVPSILYHSLWIQTYLLRKSKKFNYLGHDLQGVLYLLRRCSDRDFIGE